MSPADPKKSIADQWLKQFQQKDSLSIDSDAIKEVAKKIEELQKEGVDIDTEKQPDKSGS